MGAKVLRLLFILVISTALLADQLKAYQFNVGGKDGWVVSPSENYNHWAERMRFQVNDTLFFRYKRGTDSVLVVNQADYDKCNTQNPISKLDGGDSTFKFDRSGPFFFISGNQNQCNKGQKLIIVVLAVRHKPSPPAPIVITPAPAPIVITPAPAPAPIVITPAPAPIVITPAPAPAPETVFETPTPSPTASSSSPGSSLTPTVPSPESSSGGTPGSPGTPGTAMSPPSAPSSGDSVTPSVIFISAVTFFLSFIG